MAAVQYVPTVDYFFFKRYDELAHEIQVNLADAERVEEVAKQQLDQFLQEKIQQESQAELRVKNLLAEGLSPEQIIETLYIRTLTRRPTPEETVELMEIVKKSENPQQGLEDAFWSILNSREFLFNH